MGLSYLSSLLSLEFLWDPVGAVEGLVPTEALLGGDSGGDTRDREVRTAGRGWWQDLGHQSMPVLGSQQESPQGRICSSKPWCLWQD